MPVYSSFGSGSEKVLVLHNWFSDSTSYSPILPYLDTDKFTFLFMDLRGYGQSRDVIGKYSLLEVAEDVMYVANKLKWGRFHIIGHSMSGMIAQKVALLNPSRIKSLVGITPMPPTGSPKEDEILTFLEGAALSNEENAIECIHVLTNRRYSQYAAKKLATQWLSCSTENARLAYLHMFSKVNFLAQAKGLKTPMLILYGEHDFDEEATSHKTFLDTYPNALLECCKNAGHFPMQETPIALASSIERFLLKHSESV